jgi:hypothetical protein
MMMMGALVNRVVVLSPFLHGFATFARPPCPAGGSRWMLHDAVLACCLRLFVLLLFMLALVERCSVAIVSCLCFAFVHAYCCCLLLLLVDLDISSISCCSQLFVGLFVYIDLTICKAVLVGCSCLIVSCLVAW